MNRKHIVVGLALGVLIFSAGSSAAAPQQKGTIEFSGTFVNSDFDVNGDGSKAGYNVTANKGSLGPGTGTSVVEFEFNAAADCPAGNFGFTLVTQDAGGDPVAWRSVGRFNSTGDLLIAQYTAGTICFDPVTTIQAFTVDFEYIGGTGKYEDATGTASCDGTAVTLVEDTAGNFFGEQSGTCDFTINLN